MSFKFIIQYIGKESLFWFESETSRIPSCMMCLQDPINPDQLQPRLKIVKFSLRITEHAEDRKESFVFFLPGSFFVLYVSLSFSGMSKGQIELDLGLPFHFVPEVPWIWDRRNRTVKLPLHRSKYQIHFRTEKKYYWLKLGKNWKVTSLKSEW